MNRVLVALPEDARDRVCDELSRHGYVVAATPDSAQSLVDSLPLAQADLAVVGCGPTFLHEKLLAATDSAGVRVVGLAASGLERNHAASLGLREVLDAQARWTDLESALLGVRADAAVARAGRRGTVITVWGPAGAPGRTTIAINLAAELAAAGHTVALADVDTHSGSIAPALGLLDEAPGFAAACRLAGVDSLTRAELERIGQVYESQQGNFWVLTGIGRSSRWPELSASRVTSVLAECRDWVEFTIVDTGFSLESDEEISSDLFAPRRNGATLAALHDADHVVAVGSADPVGLSRFLRAHVDLVDEVMTSGFSVLINRIRASVVGPAASVQVRQTLLRFGGIADAVLVPHDLAGLDLAMLTGRTLVDAAPRSPARMAIAEFARGFLPQPAPAIPRLRGRRIAQRTTERRRETERQRTTDGQRTTVRRGRRASE